LIRINRNRISEGNDDIEEDTDNEDTAADVGNDETRVIALAPSLPTIKLINLR
jgi:hypothetical protein